MISAIREIELAIGDGIKRPTMSELKNKDIARKSLVATRTIQKGELLHGRKFNGKASRFWH